jgi:hypothetical protein
MYKVIKDFTDLEDNRHVYRTGDRFPRDGVEVSKERVDLLASDKNARGECLIVLVEESKKEVKAKEPKKEPEKKKGKEKK